MKACTIWPAAVLASGLVHAAPAAVEPGIAQLQKAWLQCERMALTTLLDPATAAECSQVYELLLHRMFNGDFRRMLAWWQANRERALPAPNPAPARRP